MGEIDPELLDDTEWEELGFDPSDAEKALFYKEDEWQN